MFTKLSDIKIHVKKLPYVPDHLRFSSLENLLSNAAELPSFCFAFNPVACTNKQNNVKHLKHLIPFALAVLFLLTLLS